MIPSAVPPSPASHVIWDWNGTLLADLPAVVAATNVSLRGFTQRRFTDDAYRACFSRPVRRFHESFIGGTLPDEDWRRIDDRYHHAYLDIMRSASLARYAVQGLDKLAAAGWTQSILSLASHDHLVREVSRRLGEARFLSVVGRGPGEREAKADALLKHLSGLAVSSGRVWLIGDTEDDARAATAAGIRFLLVQENSFEASVHGATFLPTVCVSDLEAAVRALLDSGDLPAATPARGR